MAGEQISPPSCDTQLLSVLRLAEIRMVRLIRLLKLARVLKMGAELRGSLGILSPGVEEFPLNRRHRWVARLFSWGYLFFCGKGKPKVESRFEAP